MPSFKTGKKDVVVFPERLTHDAGFRSGDRIAVRVRKGAVIITRAEDDFFSLEGALVDDTMEVRIKDLAKVGGTTSALW